MTKDETEADQRTEDQNIFGSQPCGKPHVHVAQLRYTQYVNEQESRTVFVV